MNAIQQISLKLQLGIEPNADVCPEVLRRLWYERTFNRKQALPVTSHRPQVTTEDAPASLHRAA